MKAIITGQIGIDKTPFLEDVQRFAQSQGETIGLCNVGQMMYAEAPDVRPGRILGLPLSRLHSLRRAVFKDIINETRDLKGHGNGGDAGHAMVNTHATFRWRHGLFPAFDFDQLREFDADVFICMVDNVEMVHHRLHNEHDIDASFKDCMVWREEEILTTELMAQAFGGRFYIVGRGRASQNTRTIFRLLCRPDMMTVYPSFPMSHVVGMPDVLAEIDQFRAALAERFIAFDPGDVDEKLMLDHAIMATKEGHDFIDLDPADPAASFGKMPGDPELAERSTIRIPCREILDIAGDIDGQIYMRDFKLIDQSDMIVSYIPELPGGVPGLSSGVERELQHAFEHTKDVYVVWKPAKNPSPFITETATKIFRSTDEALEHFESAGMTVKTHLFDG